MLRPDLVPWGLRLASRFFFDLESDLPVPLITFEIFCIVLSVIDSALANLGDLVESAPITDDFDNESIELADAIAVDATEVLRSSLKLLDFLMLEATSLLNAPSSCARFLTTRDSGFGFKIEWMAEVADGGCSDSSSSGIVGWLKLCLCFRMITEFVVLPLDPDPDETGDTLPAADGDDVANGGSKVSPEDELVIGLVCRARDGNGETTWSFEAPGPGLDPAVPGLADTIVVWVLMFNLGEVDTTTLHGGWHRGEIDFFPWSADLG